MTAATSPTAVGTSTRAGGRWPPTRRPATSTRSNTKATIVSSQVAASTESLALLVVEADLHQDGGRDGLERRVRSHTGVDRVVGRLAAVPVDAMVDAGERQSRAADEHIGVGPDVAGRCAVEGEE